MRACWSLFGLSLLYISVECVLPPSNNDLERKYKKMSPLHSDACPPVTDSSCVSTEMSQLGEKYVDKEIENAINGVKEMKTVMERSEEDHKKFLSALEETKTQKENALKVAQEIEEKLNEEQSVCNESTQALWEECKPCLRNMCVKYYSRTCSSGSGLVGRQLEELLNRSSPFSIWINGQNMETLEKADHQQRQHLQDLERRYTDVADSVDSIFMDSMRVFEHMRSLHQPPWFQRPSRVYRSIFHDPNFSGFHSMFQPMMQMTQDVFGSFGSFMNGDLTFPSGDGNMNEDVIITKPFGNDQMTCREIRRNSAGCIKLRDECEKCRAIQHIDCSGTRPLEGPLKQDLERALALAERFTREYNNLLRHFEEEMFNTSKLLDALRKQFSWVSSLANHTSNDGIFKIQTIISRDTDNLEQPGDTQVSVKLFDEPEMSFIVPGEIPWTNPKFSELVAQGALNRYKQNTVWQCFTLCQHSNTHQVSTSSSSSSSSADQDEQDGRKKATRDEKP
ncbi:Clusterin [Bagarius yarrelli]|uniref:Clusterin n=1 Tax=Bagarius yarrelli TaxID=175774 RepID=A0A556UYE5_BAGYA|nr:Clusterin [Bagarius yarrelli]